MAGSQQQGHIDWLREAKSLIKKQGDLGIVDKAALRRLISYVERLIRATERAFSVDDWLDSRDLQYVVTYEQLREAKEIYQILVGIGKWIRL